MTTLVKWAPFQELDTIERRMRRMLEELGVAPAPLPAADLYETDHEVVVELDVPGFEEKDLSLEVADHTLTIKGEHKAEKEEKEKTFYLHERLEKHFERRFKLPPEVDVERVEAKFGAGVLEVHIPKIEKVKPRTIEIGKA
ncbi:MAG TPA: Hsp20/alpha crystallin family protein [Gaiellaceae bacterium]|nr:Hsp20/alpha crystallin family protein [Gaiellaceae bacterium]